MKARLEAGYWTFKAPSYYTIHRDPIHKKILVLKEPQATIATQALKGYAEGRFETEAEVTTFLTDPHARNPLN